MSTQSPTIDRQVIEKNLEVVEAHFHDEHPEGIERALRLYTEDIVWEAPARGVLRQGKEPVKENYLAMFASAKDIELIPLQRFGTEDRVVDDTIARFTLTGDGWINAPYPVGTRVEVRVVHIFEMRDGLISRETGYEIWKSLDE
jgi:ketosteroid isomerase-like protein